MELIHRLRNWFKYMYIVWRYTNQIHKLIAKRDKLRFNGDLRSATAVHATILRAAKALDLFKVDELIRSRLLSEDISTLGRFCGLAIRIDRERRALHVDVTDEIDMCADVTTWRTTQRLSLQTGPLSIEPITES